MRARVTQEDRGRQSQCREVRGLGSRHDRRAPRPRCVLRGGRGTRGSGSPHEAPRRRRRPAWARRGRDRELRGAQVRDPFGDELRRSAAPLPAQRLHPAAALALPRVLATRLGDGSRSRADGRANRARRGLPRSRRRCRALPRCPRGRRGRQDCRPGRDEPDLFDRSGELEGRRQDRQRPPQARRTHRRAVGSRGRLSRSVRRAAFTRRRPEGRGTPARRGGGHDRRAGRSW